MLANTGHIQTLICPPNNPKARYWVGGSRGPTPTRGRPAPRSAPRNVVGHWAEWGHRAVRGRETGTGRAGRRRPSGAGRRAGHLRAHAGLTWPCRWRSDRINSAASKSGDPTNRRPHKPATHKPAPSGWDPRHPVVTGGAAGPANRDRDLPPLAINTFCTVTLRVLSIACTAGPGCWIKPIRRRQVRCEHKEAGG